MTFQIVLHLVNDIRMNIKCDVYLKSAFDSRTCISSTIVPALNLYLSVDADQ